ncbi:MAG TPA: hypothetical protein VFN68_16910 [Acidimicrobiales bacterium]|nr:hypothetical protein [Acidimicrobiales bacterium]
MPGFLECVINVSEGRDADRLAGLARAAGATLLDVHTDADHHRSVLTLCGPHPPGSGPSVQDAARAVARQAVAAIDLGRHSGAHPRFGAVDVVPWVALSGWPLQPGDLAVATGARDAFARWAGRELGLPAFLYGPERSLPDVRRGAWRSLEPDEGPPRPHPTAGAVAVGARPALVAYNLWLAEADLDRARRVAAGLRGPQLRTLGIPVGSAVQVSCNLIDPWQLGPGAVYDAVAARVEVGRAELVGLLPRSVLDAEPRHRWAELGLDGSATIEARLERAGLDGGSFGL